MSLARCRRPSSKRWSRRGAMRSRKARSVRPSPRRNGNKSAGRSRRRRATSLAEKGPFPLILADPPWKWGHFGEQDQENEEGKGAARTSTTPTMTHDEILDHCVDGKPVVELAHADAVLFLWCTSSNVPRALEVMERWGFEFKSSAAWVKMKDGKLQTGMGLVFRNAHEILLYGTRGAMPGPQPAALGLRLPARQAQREAARGPRGDRADVPGLRREDAPRAVRPRESAGLDRAWLRGAAMIKLPAEIVRGAASTARRSSAATPTTTIRNPPPSRSWAPRKTPSSKRKARWRNAYSRPSVASLSRPSTGPAAPSSTGSTSSSTGWPST